MTGDLSRDSKLSNSYDVDMPPDNSEALKRTLLSVTIVPSGTIPNEIQMITDMTDFQFIYGRMSHVPF